MQPKPKRVLIFKSTIDIFKKKPKSSIIIFFCSGGFGDRLRAGEASGDGDGLVDTGDYLGVSKKILSWLSAISYQRSAKEEKCYLESARSEKGGNFPKQMGQMSLKAAGERQ